MACPTPVVEADTSTPRLVWKPAIYPSQPSVFIRLLGVPDRDKMNLRDHPEDDGKKVWLSEDELDQLVNTVGDMEQRIAIELGGRCGLRSKEILDVASQHVVETDAGHMLRVWKGKGDKYRETPISESLATKVEAVAYRNGCDPDEPVLSVSTTRSLRRWVKHAAADVADEIGDDAWHYLSTHDLRRTWATSLSDHEVDPLIALEWGGWEDLDTFLDHYKGAYSPAAQRRAREKVDWL